MAKHADRTPQTKITRDDLEHQFRALQGEVREKVDDQRSTLATVAGVSALVVVLIIYLIGRRSGRKKNTIVEIRRV